MDASASAGVRVAAKKESGPTGAGTEGNGMRPGGGAVTPHTSNTEKRDVVGLEREGMLVVVASGVELGAAEASVCA